MKYRIYASKIIPCVDNNIIKDGYIEIEDGYISAIGRKEELSDEKFLGTEISYSDKTLMPGLINSHEHLVTKSKYTDWTLDTIKMEPIPFQSVRALRNARNLLREGVTTIRECGSRGRINISISRANKEGLVITPDIIACGSPISILGGHCYYYSHQITSTQEGVAAVRKELMYGADFIKIHATGGAGTKEGSPLWPELSLEEITAIVDEAHSKEKRVCSHAIGREGIKNSIFGNVDTIEHGHYLDDELIELMVKRGIYYIPTLTGYIPLAINGLEMGRPQWMVDKAKKLLEKHQEVMEKIKKYPELIIAAGSDSSGSVAEEAYELCKSGFSNIDVLHFVTRNGADALGVLDKKGTLEVGKDADVIVLDGDPLDNIKSLSHIKQVFKKGEYLNKLEK